MKQVTLTFLALIVTASAHAADARTWIGRWNNRKFGSSGPLKCVATETAPGQWDAVFTGTFQRDPFVYKARFQSKRARQGIDLGGNAVIRGQQYQWTGSLRGRQLRGSYRANNGFFGEFLLNEQGGGTPDRPTEPPDEATLPVTQSPTLKNGERMLFIGNSYMANEGGVYNYLARALEKDRLKISTNKRIYYGRPLRDMMKTEVRTQLASDEFDSVVITSGQLNVMKQFAARIKASGKRTIVFMTWEARHPGNRATEKQYTDATRRAVQYMRRMERDTGATIVPAAVAFHDLTLRPPDGVSRVDYLWRPKNIHQNEIGTMVNAWMFYTILTGKTPVGVNFDMPPFVVGQRLKQNPDIEFNRDLRAALQERIWKVAQDWKAGRTHLE